MYVLLIIYRNIYIHTHRNLKYTNLVNQMVLVRIQGIEKEEIAKVYNKIAHFALFSLLFSQI